MIGEPAITVPDVTRYVIGYRTFRLAGGALYSPFQGTEWARPELTACCAGQQVAYVIGQGRAAPHEAPAKDCRCGIYAYSSPSLVRHSLGARFGDPVAIAALMVLWGRLEVHPHGVRAEHARICAVGRNPSLAPTAEAELAAVAERLGVELVDELELESLAPRYGAPLDPSLIPEPELSAGLVFGPATITTWPRARRRRLRRYWTAASWMNAGAAAANAVMLAQGGKLISAIALTVSTIAFGICVSQARRSRF